MFNQKAETIERKVEEAATHVRELKRYGKGQARKLDLKESDVERGKPNPRLPEKKRVASNIAEATLYKTV